MKHFLGRHPSLFYPAHKLFVPGYINDECLLSPEAELVIEGFPRSANTFSVVAFRQAQCRSVPMAHHLHVEAQILEGVRRKLPVMVLIRDPIDAVKSLLIRHPDTDVAWAFTRYIQFYEAVYEVREGVVLARFEEVTNDFGATIERLNQKFGTTYTRYENTEENSRRVFDEIGKINQMRDGGKEMYIARPSATRKEIEVNIDMTGKSGAAAQRAIEVFKALAGGKVSVRSSASQVPY